MTDLIIKENYNPLICSYEECRAYTKRFAKSFYFASFLLPKEKRNAAYSVYSFCRLVDNIADSYCSESPPALENKFSIVHRFLDDVYSGKAFEGKNFSAFAETVRRYGISRSLFDELIEGVKTDLRKNRYETFAELENYCYKVASVVGLIMTEIFGYSDKIALQYAMYLGKAMQLTNILRDIGEDYRLGRIYIPSEELQCFGYSEKDIADGVINQNFKMLMKFNIDRARMYYELASHGIPYLTDDGSRTTVVLMLKIYSAILDEIENHGYDVYSSRRYVKTIEKFKMAGYYFINKEERKKFIPPRKYGHQRIRSLYPGILPD
ncbi:MAG: phytoene/squalene synthase family protein [Ignavibacteria bacterium]|nr:phytoene/squalene synthase family protein [Ignavibacteria bacterium]